jgi:hypothetical protein
MAMQDSDTELLLLILLLQGMEDEDPFVGEMLYERLRHRLIRSELFDPEIDHLLRRRLHFPSRSRERRLSESREIANSVLDGFRKSFQETTSSRIEKLESIINEVDSKSDSIKGVLSELQNELEDQKKNTQEYFWLLSSGADLNQVPITRFMPVRVYVSDPVPQQSTLNGILESIEKLLGDVGFERSDEFPEESGSWWKKIVVKTKGLFTQKEVNERLQKVERAAEIAYLDKPQAEANQCQAQAASSLISSLSDIANACIQAGSLLLVKATNNGSSSIVARTLTPMELKLLEENQAMLRKPEKIINWLQQAEKKRLTKP